MRIAFDKMQPPKFEDKINNFKQYCTSNAKNPKMTELLSIKYFEKPLHKAFAQEY